MSEEKKYSQKWKNSETLLEDNFELIDFLKVIWKWKLLIVGGMFALGLLSAIYGFNMTKIYSTQMVLRLGIVTIADDGEKVYIDTPENLKALINSGTFNYEIINYFKKNNIDTIPQNLKFIIEAPIKANILKIHYLTSNVEQGIEVLNLLYNQLVDEYNIVVQRYRIGFNNKLSIVKSEITMLKTAKQNHEMNLNNLELRIKELESEVISIKANIKDLLEENTKFFGNQTDESRILSAMLYSNTIQQNIAFANTYKDEIYKYRIQKERQTQQIRELEKRIEKNLMEIDKLVFYIENIENIQNIQPPSGTFHPIKPKIKVIILLGLVSGFVLSVFAAFFTEFIIKYRKMNLPIN